MRTVLHACTLALIGLLPLFGGCAESRAERTFRRVVAAQETVPLPEVRDELQALIKRWPQTKAAVKAQQEIQWIDDLLGAASRGPLLRAFDAIRTVSRATEKYKAREGRLPETIDDLIPRDLPVPIVDPWGVPVRYARNAGGFTVVSYGADGIPGGSGDATDFVIENGKFVYGRKL
jgi:hypothetical protein